MLRVRELKTRIRLNFKEEIETNRVEFLTSVFLVAQEMSQNLLTLGESVHIGHSAHVRRLLGAISLDNELENQKQINSRGDEDK